MNLTKIRQMNEVHLNSYELAANIGIFLISRGLKTWDSWNGKLSAKEQRKYFGEFFGKGTIHINGLDETLEMTIKVCFGQDYAHIVSLDAKQPSRSFDNRISCSR